MKKLAGSLFIAFMAGALTLAGYVLFFQKSNYIVAEPRTPLVTTSATNTSFLGNMEGVDFTVAAEKTVNAVVHVTNLSVSKPSRSYEWFYGSGRGGTPQVGTGSGVIISADGYIVTNNHVIANSQLLQVTLNNNSTYEAKLIGTDPNFDIALIKIEPDVAHPTWPLEIRTIPRWANGCWPWVIPLT
jgi:S1-C subfamily serine protease